MAIRLRKDLWKKSAPASEPKKVYTESVAWLAEQTFLRWRDGYAELFTACRESYLQAVRLGYLGHVGSWVDHVLKTGNMAVTDLQPAFPQDRRPDLWPEGRPKTLDELRRSA